MLIIPTVDGNNLTKCNNIIRILRGFVSIIGIHVSEKNINYVNLIKVFDKQQAELELFLPGDDHEKKLQKIITAHSDVNIGKVYFYTNDENNVEQQITNVRVFGIQPGIIVDKENYQKISIINKFEYAVIIVANNPNYLEIYKHIKENSFTGNLFLDFGETAVPQDILKNINLDGVYTEVTNNPMIKDTISSYRKLANSSYY